MSEVDLAGYRLKYLEVMAYFDSGAVSLYYLPLEVRTKVYDQFGVRNLPTGERTAVVDAVNDYLLRRETK